MVRDAIVIVGVGLLAFALMVGWLASSVKDPERKFGLYVAGGFCAAMTLFFLVVSALHLLAVAAVAILVLIGVRMIQGAYRRVVGSPRLNPNPAQLVSFTGAVPGSLDAPALIAIYSTTYRLFGERPRRECVAWHDWFSGASGPKTVELRVPTSRRADSVEAEVYPDRYLPCRCNWLLREVKVEIIDPASGGKPGSHRIGYGRPYYDATYLLGTTPINKIDDLVTFHCQTYPWGVACSPPKVPGPEGVAVWLRPQAKARFVAIHDPS